MFNVFWWNILPNQLVYVFSPLILLVQNFLLGPALPMCPLCRSLFGVGGSDPLNIPDNWMGQLFVLFQANFNFESISAYLISPALSRSPFWIPLCYGTCQAILSMFYLCLSTFGTQTKTFSFHANSWDVQSVPGSILSGSHNMDTMDFCPGPLPPVCLPVGGQWCPTG